MNESQLQKTKLQVEYLLLQLNDNAISIQYLQLNNLEVTLMKD